MYPVMFPDPSSSKLVLFILTDEDRASAYFAVILVDSASLKAELVLVGVCASAEPTDPTGGSSSSGCSLDSVLNSGNITNVITQLESVAAGSASQFAFFQSINNFLGNEINYLQTTLLNNNAETIGFVALILLTIWIIYQGYRITTGRIQTPMMLLVGDSLKAFLVISIATAAAASSSSLYWTLTDGTATAVNELVNGDGAASPYDQIDQSLAEMEGMMMLIDTLSGGSSAATGINTDSAAQSATDRAKWFTGIGLAGPSVVGGAVLLLNKIAVALFVGLGPIFIICLLFDYTKNLLQRWLLYGIGTLFSLAVLSFMVSIALKVILAVTLAIVTKYAVMLATCSLGGSEGITSMALQQGGLGLILSTLIVSAPPMAAAFFQGTLGQFMSYSAFGNVGARNSPGYSNAAAQGRAIPQSSTGQVAYQEQPSVASNIPAIDYSPSKSSAASDGSNWS